SVRVWETIELTPQLRQQRQAAALVNRLTAEAAALVNRLTAELLIKEDVRQSLRQDATLSEPLRRQALALLEQYREDQVQFRDRIWGIISHPDAEPAQYQRALHLAQVLVRMDIPDSQPYFLFTLGTVQYRIGNYQDAVDTLKRADALARAKGD